MAGDFSLAGRGVAVTGGGGHLGSALSLGLAAAGATVVACGRRAEPLRRVAAEVERLGVAGRVVPCVADLARDGDLDRVLEAVEAEAGRVDGWVNNATGGPGGLLFSLGREAVEETLARGLGDLLLATQAAARRMQARGGSIVNVASMYGIVSPQPATYREHPQYHNPPAYGAAKAGVVQFTRYAACHLAGRGIRVNCVSPGPFPREPIRRDPGFADELARRVPLGRVGEPQELVGPVVFLLSDASSYVNGHNLVVDGGWTAW